jgi:hypothetical protein
VESKIGKGSTFHFTIPRISGNVPLCPKNINLKYNNINYGNCTILVAEDEEVNFLLIKEMLEGVNLNVLWARNGEKR